jgi:hypothetical protein
MRVGILYTIAPTTDAATLLDEFAGGTLHGRAMTSTCELYASGSDALFLGPSGTFGNDGWIEGDAVALAWADDYAGVHSALADAGLTVAAKLAAT